MNTQKNQHPAFDLYLVKLCEAIDPETIAMKVSSKNPNIDQSIRAITLLMADEITKDDDVRAEMIFAFMLQSGLSPIPFYGEDITSFLDEVTPQTVRKFIEKFSEVLGAPIKNELESWEEDERQRESYYKGEG